MKTYEISVDGCDDSTQIVEELTESEYKLLKRIAKNITETSRYGCMPVMEIKEVKED